ncbi:hypothetical protein [Cupriavidus gilardii]|uniref:hypothetical protein n=1 Tax=Cupriavidus gilardii TaxID=82541 RepID=UPI001571D849|nr:hypothetical protein [Cupriavidus gilardii]NSX03538.1 hypothetical protein [Cupriavidus gilardii]
MPYLLCRDGRMGVGACRIDATARTEIGAPSARGGKSGHFKRSGGRPRPLPLLGMAMATDAASSKLQTRATLTWCPRPEMVFLVDLPHPAIRTERINRTDAPRMQQQVENEKPRNTPGLFAIPTVFRSAAP